MAEAEFANTDTCLFIYKPPMSSLCSTLTAGGNSAGSCLGSGGIIVLVFRLENFPLALHISLHGMWREMSQPSLWSLQLLTEMTIQYPYESLVMYDAG